MQEKEMYGAGSDFRFSDRYKFPEAIDFGRLNPNEEGGERDRMARGGEGEGILNDRDSISNQDRKERHGISLDL
jgi:hypothetical protein